ncbi:MAG: hypothetical protein ABI609_13665 [Acidobacteriota bacterium]
MKRHPRLTWAGALFALALATGACRSAAPTALTAHTGPTTSGIAALYRPCPHCERAPALRALAAAKFEPLTHAHVLATYLPDSDRDGKTFDAEPWETEALKLQGHLFGGATSWPSRGSYRESDAAGAIGSERMILEHTRMVVSFATEHDFSAAALGELAAFLDRFKRETGQDSVAVVIDGEMYLH